MVQLLFGDFEFLVFGNACEQHAVKARFSTRTSEHVASNERTCLLVDHDGDPCIVSEKREPIHTHLLVSLGFHISGGSTGVNGGEERTATHNFSTKPGAVETVASAERNQQSPRAPWIMSFEPAPSTKK